MVLAKKLGNTFWEVSPLKRHGINKIFRYLTLLLLGRQSKYSNDVKEINVETL
jgi:hypothetical protein